MPERNLEQELDDLRARVDAIEAQSAGHPWVPPIIDRLNQKIDERTGESGHTSPTLVGHIEVNALIRSSNGSMCWSEDTAAEDILDASADALARSIGGLAHPARIALARALLSGPKESAALLDIAGLNTTGQLYHHLQAMADIGIVERRGRNLWAALNTGPVLLLMFAGHELSKWRGDNDDQPTEDTP